MARHSWIASASFILILLGLPALAQKPVGLPNSVTSKIEATIAEEVSRNKLPGLSAVVVADRQLKWSKGFGKADLDAVRCRYADITKPSVDFRQEKIVSIDPHTRHVVTDNGEYDADVVENWTAKCSEKNATAATTLSKA